VSETAKTSEPLEATRVEIAAAKLRLLVDNKLGRESDEVIKAIANAHPVDDAKKARPAS
jgi:hypothetical protein